MDKPANDQTPACDLCEDNAGPVFVHQRCHMTAPLQASLENGVLTLSCYVPECRRIVVQMRVTEIVPGK